MAKAIQAYISRFHFIMVSLALLLTSAAQARDLLVVSKGSNAIQRYDSLTGALTGTHVSGLNNPSHMVVGPDDHIYVTNSGSNTVTRHDGQTGALISTFVSSGAGGLSNPQGLTFGANGNLYVVSQNNAGVLEYDGSSGAFVQAVIIIGQGLIFPSDMVRGPDDFLYVADFFGNSVHKVNPVTKTMTTFVAPNSGGLSSASGLVFSPSGNLFVSSYNNDSIKQYNGSTGAFINTFIGTGLGGLDNPRGLAFGAVDGHLYVASSANNTVKRYSASTGALIDNFAATGLNNAYGLGFMPDPPVNQAPVANAGPNQTVDEYVLVTLDGSGSFDPEMASLNYNWTQVDGTPVILNTANPINPTFTSPEVPAGGEVLSFELVVFDGELYSAPSTVHINVTNVNNPPVASAGLDQTVQEASPVTLDGSGSFDPDMHPLQYDWIQTAGPAVTLTNPQSAQPTFTSPIVAVATILTFQLTVTDGQAMDTDTVNVTVSNNNQAPVANAGPNQFVMPNDAVTLDGSASFDPEQSLLQYTWIQVAGPTVNLDLTDPMKPVFTAPVVAATTNLKFDLIVNDGLESSAPDRVRVRVIPVDAPPECDNPESSIPNIWPPDGTMVKVKIKGVSDDYGRKNLSFDILSVYQDEPLTGNVDAKLPASQLNNENGTIKVRASRNTTGLYQRGRVYKIDFRATDQNQQSCTGTIKVCVPLVQTDLLLPNPCLEDPFVFDSSNGNIP